MEDARDGFPIFIDAIKQLQPKVFLFENVRNLAYSHKFLYKNNEILGKIGFFSLEHDELPDVVAYCEEKTFFF